MPAERAYISGQVPLFGLIEGGLLDGWRQHFLGFAVEGDELFVDMRCARPGWPFPKEIRFHYRDLKRLARVRGERAGSLSADAANALIDAAYDNPEL